MMQEGGLGKYSRSDCWEHVVSINNMQTQSKIATDLVFYEHLMNVIRVLGLLLALVLVSNSFKAKYLTIFTICLSALTVVVCLRAQSVQELMETMLMRVADTEPQQ